MAASNQLGSNMQMEPVQETQSNGTAKPLIHRFSRNHKITAPRNLNGDTRPTNRHVIPAVVNPPRFNIIQQYQTMSMNLRPQFPQLPNRTDIQAQTPVCNQPSWPSMTSTWNHVTTPFPLLQQAAFGLPTRPNVIHHEQNTIYGHMGENVVIQRENFMATQALGNFLDRSQNAREHAAPTFQFEERQRVSIPPPLQSINFLAANDLKRMAELSRLQTRQNELKETCNLIKNESTNEIRSELVTYLTTSTMAATETDKEVSELNAEQEKNDENSIEAIENTNKETENDNDEIEIISSSENNQVKIKMESPITISDDESQEARNESSIIRSESQNSSHTDELTNDSKHDTMEPQTEQLEPQTEQLEPQTEQLEHLNPVIEEEKTENLPPNIKHVIKLRFCTVRNLEGNLREIVPTPLSENTFSVYCDKNGIVGDKLSGPIFKRKANNESLNMSSKKQKLKNGNIFKVVTNNWKKLMKQKHSKVVVSSNSTHSTSTDKTGRKFIDVTICSKCKCKVHDGKPCDFTDIYPCLDDKCQKFFLDFQKYRAHVNAHGYNVTESPAEDDGGLDTILSPIVSLTEELKCMFCSDKFSQYDNLELHLKQFHQVKNESEFFNTDNPDSLFTKIDIWLQGFRGEKTDHCKLCLNDVSGTEIEQHLTEIHSCQRLTTRRKPAVVKPKKLARRASYVVPAMETLDKDVSSTKVIVRDVQMVEPDITRDKTAPSLKDVEKWLLGLEDAANVSEICCLFCKKMYLSAFAMYKHVIRSHGSSTEKLLGKYSLRSLEDLDNSYSVKDKLSSCCDLPDMERVSWKLKILLTHLMDSETLDQFEFDSLPMNVFLVRILYSLGTSYCMFETNENEDLMFDGFCRNVRTLILSCVAEEVRKIVGFYTETVETILDNLFEFIGIV